MSFCLQLAASTNLRFETGANAPSNFSISSQTSLRVGVWCACVTKAQHISINLSTIHDETEFDKYGAQNFRRQFDRQFSDSLTAIFLRDSGYQTSPQSNLLTLCKEHVLSTCTVP